MPLGLTVRTWLESLADEHGGIEMDCSIFSQLCLVNPEDSAFILHMPLSNIISTLMPSLCYIRADDDEMKAVLDSLPTFSKGMWLVKIGPDSFFGLSETVGGVSRTFSEWTNLMTCELQRDIDSKKNSADIYTIADLMIRMGKLKWTFMESFFANSFSPNSFSSEPLPFSVKKTLDTALKPSIIKRRDKYPQLHKPLIQFNRHPKAGQGKR